MAASSTTELREHYRRRLAELESAQSPWRSHWQDLSDFIQPRRGEFVTKDGARGSAVNDNIINGTATWAVRTLAAGMASAITSAARPWFRLTTADPYLAELSAAKDYLYLVEDRIRWAFARSNIYKSFPSVYYDLGYIGTAPMLIEDDPVRTLRTYTFPVGSYYIANDDRGRVDTMYRRFNYTVGQLVQKFGLQACGTAVQRAFKEKRYDEQHLVLHAVEPNYQAEPGRRDWRGMAFSSCWLELNGDDDKLLRRHGFREFPAPCPRWVTHGQDVYGHAPGMDVLGDTKALQLLEKRKLQLVEKSVNPPMRGPMELQNKVISLVPGGFTGVNAVSPANSLQPAHEVQPAAIVAVTNEISAHERRIKTGLYADLFLVLDSIDKAGMTAREVIERVNERMLQLGPTLETINDELLDPTIDRTFNILERNGLLPPPPEELLGQELRVEYTGILAQAQKALATGNLRELLGLAGSIFEFRPDAFDKLDTDQMIDEFATSVGVNPNLVRTDEVVAKIRAERAKELEQQKQLAQGQAAVEGAKTLSETDTEGDNALTRIMESMGAGRAAGGYVPR